MMDNFTRINDLVKKTVVSSTRGSKETEPTPSQKEYSGVQEVVEHEVPQEVEKFVKSRKETIDLPPDIKKLGVQSSGTSQFSTYQNVKLPISDDKVLVGLHAPITSSFRWLATFALYLLRCAHLALKKVHGKVIRVVR